VKRKYEDGAWTVYVWPIGETEQRRVLYRESMERAMGIASKHGIVREVFMNNEQGFEYKANRAL
jgi:hypothetical protein